MTEEDSKHQRVDPEPPDQEEFTEFQVKVGPPESYVYANLAGISVSPTDIRIHFADVRPIKDAGVEATTVAGVIMSPEYASSLALLLTSQLSSYERQFGAIRSPQWRAMVDHAEEKVARAVKDAEQQGAKPKTKKSSE